MHVLVSIATDRPDNPEAMAENAILLGSARASAWQREFGVDFNRMISEMYQFLVGRAYVDARLANPSTWAAERLHGNGIPSAKKRFKSHLGLSHVEWATFAAQLKRLKISIFGWPLDVPIPHTNDHCWSAAACSSMLDALQLPKDQIKLKVVKWTDGMCFMWSEFLGTH